MTIYLGTDHAGFDLKERIKKFIADDLGYDINDMGADVFDPTDDYPDFIMPVAQAVATDRAHGGTALGVIFGGSGQGEAMVANRVRGVRCAVYYGGSTDIITLSREHNDANMLSLGARFLSVDETMDVVRLWIATQFSGEERHIRRIEKY